MVAHLINLIATILCYIYKFKNIPDGYVFVSPNTQLHWTSYALLLQNGTANKCNLQIPDHMTIYPDFLPHSLYDFSNKFLIQYNKDGVEFNVIIAMIFFFVLSLCFQTTHYYYLRHNPSMPRVLHYIEYSFSSSLMIMVLAINTGIVEFYAVLGFAAIFFGMNMLGAAAEAFCHYLGYIPEEKRITVKWLIWLPHCAGWVLFFFTMIPIWIQMNIGITCSDGGNPNFVIAAITVQSICFFTFGFLQIASLKQKIAHCKSNSTPDPELLFFYDCCHALLSLVAKTLLAWILMGAAASANIVT